jgi:hypothetical protein
MLALHIDLPFIVTITANTAYRLPPVIATLTVKTAYTPPTVIVTITGRSICSVSSYCDNNDNDGERYM